MEYSNGKTIYGCIAERADAAPDVPAIIETDKGAENIVTWSQLKNAVNNMALAMKEEGVEEGARIVAALPNSIGAVVSALAGWRLGACVFFLSPELVSGERRELLSQVRPALVLSSWKDVECRAMTVSDKLDYSFNAAAGALPDLVSKPSKATATGGSTGIPKIILEEAPMLYGAEDFAQWEYVTGQHAGQTLLVCGSLHHSLFNNSFYISMALGNTAVLMKRFDEAAAVAAIEKYAVNNIVLVPTMMSRIIRCGAVKTANLGSVRSLQHAGASCPVWLKKEWIDLLGPEKIYEFYSMSEKVGMTTIRGDEWLRHEGSVGRPMGAEIRILGDDMQNVPAGTVGNVYFVSDKPRTTHYLLDTQQYASDGGSSVSVGDLGYLDAEGYLYLVDRRSDMIISGGKNIYVTEVENALREYRNVRDIAVVGLPDPVWGRRVHAIIEPSCPAEEFGVWEFASFGFRALSNFKLPKTMELVEKLPRDESGKLRRRALAEERAAADSPEGSGRFRIISVPNGHQILAWRAKKSKEAKKAE